MKSDPPPYSCDIAVISGSLGGVAAALAAARAGYRVVLSEATDWIGGQVTSQGVSALDEHLHIEQFGATRSYAHFRDQLRTHYKQRYRLPDEGGPPLNPVNPGNAWVSRLAFEPKVGLEVLESMLEPHIASGRLSILREHVPVAADTRDQRVMSITLRAPDESHLRVHAAYVLDATDLGDLLPLTHTAYLTGAEAQADTGEANAKADAANPEEVQGFTFCFAMAYCPGEHHVIPKPAGYEAFRNQQPYSFVLDEALGNPKRFYMFRDSPEGLKPFWTYRRLRDSSLLGGRDLALINWAGNDYHTANLIDKPVDEQARILAEAKRLALGFAHWLQSDAPRDEGGRGYPELRLAPEVMGTRDGLSKAPYIRESRRLQALTRVVEEDIAANGHEQARAKVFPDAAGIGWYAMDLHACVGNPQASRFAPTRPFQIPLGALIPQHTQNLLAACKNLGTTHLTSGAYRTHPCEWAIGEAAGTLAAFCLEHQSTPQQVHANPNLLSHLQLTLVSKGIPIAWALDVPPEHPDFVAIQLLMAAGALPEKSERATQLEIQPDKPLSATERDAARRAAAHVAAIPNPQTLKTHSWHDMCQSLKPYLPKTPAR